MTKSERVRYEMLLRVRDFGNEHHELFPELSAGGQAFAQVAQATARIGAHATRKPLTAADGREAIVASRALLLERLRLVVRTARGIRKAEGVNANPLRMTRRVSDDVRIQTARRFLDVAEERRDDGLVRDQLVRLGLPVTCLAELRQAADDLEAALSARRGGRRGVASAQAGIASALADGLAAVHTLDIVVPNAVESNPEVFAAWKRDRRVVERRSKATDAPDVVTGEEVLSKAS